MTSKQERLKEVYNHLRSNFGIHTQIDFAEAIRITRPALSSAMNGNEAYLTKNLFQKICAAYPGVFDLNYLLTGEGSLLAIEEEVHNEEYEKLYNPQPLDQSSLINATIAAKDEAIASLKRELQTKNDLIQSLHDQLAAKDQLIAEQKARLIDYRRIIDSHNGISDYPFPIGAAENNRDKSLI